MPSRRDPTAAAGAAEPRVLHVALGPEGVALEARAFASGHPGVARVGALGGAGLAAALVHGAEPAAGRPCLAVAVGPAVVRGVPTAARATVAGAPAPLTGRFADGQVGGELAARLAALADGLCLTGAGRGDPGTVLVLAGDRREPRASLAAFPELAGASPAETNALLVARLGPCATLCVGPAGERGAPAASLAADGAHFVGRGGLGALLGRLGLKALAVRTEPARAEPDALGAPGPAGDTGERLVRWLLSSPRLAVRAAEGSLELFGELAARGSADAAGVAAEARDRARDRKGCRGCPTPCGWVFATDDGPRPGHFSANRALGAELGLRDLEASLALLAECDAQGLDAKEVGPALALACDACEAGELAAPSPRGDRDALRAWIRSAGAGEGPGALLAGGARAVARRLGRADGSPGSAPAGSAASPARDPAERVAARVGTRGGDPMRVFPFLVGAGAGAAGLAARVAPLALPPGADDPGRLAGKGRLAWWHESLVAALDASGFCAFSAAGLLADGVASLDQLAAALRGEPEGDAGLRLLADGAALAHLHRALDAQLAGGAPPGPGDDDPALVHEVADYARLRGVDADGRPTPEAAARFARGLDPVDLARVPAPEPAAPSAATPAAPAGPARPGRVRLRAAGALGRALGERREVDLDLPARLRDVLAVAARDHPAGEWLLRDGEPLPSAWRAGVRVGPDDPVRDGDELDLVLALRGG